MAQCGRLTVAPPPADTFAGGLFAAATFPQVPPGPHWQCGVQYESDNCANPGVFTEACPPAVPDPKEQTLQFPVVEGDPFTVYLGIDCNLPGYTLAEFERRLRATLANCSQKAIEAAYWTGSAGNLPRLAGTALDPSDCVALGSVDAPLTIAGGVSTLESYMGDRYCGTPVIHTPRGVAAYAAQAQLMCGGCDRGPQRTPLGSRWAFGAGYSVNTGPDGVPAPDGVAWMYATGQVSIWRSEIFVTPEQLEQAFNVTNNAVTMFAEQTVVITHECACAAVPVTIGCSC